MSPPDDPPSPLSDVQSAARAATRDDERADASDSTWRRRAVSLGYAAYFPAVFVGTVVAPFLLAQVTALSVLAAFRYAMVVAAAAYLGGLLALCR
jgi:hypothetical protein